MATSDQLERLLYILPAAARGDGARLEDLARALDVSPSVILGDIEQATARAFYQPAGSVDAINILVDGEFIRVVATSEFKRPVRLNAREAMALELGLRVLASEADAARRSEILAFAERLIPEVEAPLGSMLRMLTTREAREPREDAPMYDLRPVQVELGEDDFRGVLTDAIEQNLICVIEYLKAGGKEPERRRIAPQRLIYASGHWYVGAKDVDAGAARNFRLDRILRVNETTEAYAGERASGRAGERANAVYVGSVHEYEVRVRYSARIARWIAEHRDVEREADGSVVITHRVSDPQWLVRHVLQYGGEAAVEGSPLMRVVAEAAGKICA